MNVHHSVEESRTHTYMVDSISYTQLDFDFYYYPSQLALPMDDHYLCKQFGGILMILNSIV